jgi:hypothetical protein
MADLVYYLVTTNVFGAMRIGIFAPKMEQAGIMFERIKTNYNMGKKLYEGLDWGENNANNFKLSNGSFIKTITASDKSSIEGETFHLIIIDEAEAVSDTKLTKSIFPMGAATNSTRVLIGTPAMSFTNEYGKDCRYFYDGLIRYRGTPFSYEVSYTIPCRYNENYGKFVINEMDRIGEDSDEFKTQYKLEWLLETSHFLTYEKLKLLRSFTLKRMPYWSQTDCYAGLDLAKSPESTVLTIGSIWDRGFGSQAKKKIVILNWLELKGEDYQDQAMIVGDYLSKFKIVNIAIDTTGAGSPAVEIFRRHIPQYSITEIKWTTESHNDLYKKLQHYIERQRIEYPCDKSRESKEFERQFLNLQKEYRGSKMMCHHPERRGAFDDYCSSLAMLVWVMDLGIADTTAAPPIACMKLIKEMGLDIGNPSDMFNYERMDTFRQFD